MLRKLKKLIKYWAFLRRWKQVKDLTIDHINFIEHFKIINPLTEKPYRVIAVFKNIDYWYVLENGYICVCNKDSGHPLPNKVYKPKEKDFMYTASTWLPVYIRERSEAKYGR